MVVLLAISLGLTAAPSDAQDHAAVYAQAVAARRAGDASEASRLLAKVLTDEPNDTDALVQYGYALLELDRRAEAEQAFRKVISLAPAYADAKLGLARIAQRRGDVAGAREWLESLPADDPEAKALRKQLATHGDDRWALDAGVSTTAVSRGQRDWREISGQLTWRASAQSSLIVRVEDTRRFGLRDTYSEAQFSQRVSPTVSTYVLAGVTPHANYRPRWQIGGGISDAIRGGTEATVLSFDLRTAKYDTGQVTTLQPGIEQHFSDGKAWATGRLIILVNGGQAQIGALGRLDVVAGPKMRVFAGAANAPDTSVGTVIRETSVFGGLQADLGPQQIVRFSIAHTKPQIGPSRMEFAIGAGLKFR